MTGYIGGLPEAPKGKIWRAGYTKKAYTMVRDGKKIKVKSSKVAPSLVKDKGKPGKTPKSKKVLPKLEKNVLGKYGYHDVKHMSSVERHDALKKAVKAKGVRKTYGHIIVAASYVKNTSPSTYKKMRSDVKWMHKKYYSKK